MKILALADEVCKPLWDYYSPGKLSQYDLILSSGDLKAEYLSFLVTMARCPLLYVHGNHDGSYDQKPPEGCDCLDDKLVIYKGVRILGLGGSSKYNNSPYQYTEKQMRKRIKKLRQVIKLAGGVDIVLAHAAPRGFGDQDDLAHRGFQAFLEFIDEYHPQYVLHGHVHLNYGPNICRHTEYGGTKVINCFERYEVECETKCKPASPLLENGLFRKYFAKNYLYFFC